jgi:uroporphyrinogen decarboxylase
MDVLCQMDPDGIRTYTLTVLDQACKYRGVAFGSGNSIPDYVPTEGYLAMVKAIREFRGEGR